MELSTLILLLINFSVIGLLPKFFFRQDGQFTLMWLMTATPYLLAPVAFSFQYFYPTSQAALSISPTLAVLFNVIGISLSALSIGIIFMTIGTHRIPVALWHQKQHNDKPKYIVTWGSYKYVRHPFYTSFLLAFTACILLTLNWFVMGLAIYTLLILTFTAIKEEKRLSNEPADVGQSYRRYIERTGRFVPKPSYIFSRSSLPTETVQ